MSHTFGGYKLFFIEHPVYKGFCLICMKCIHDRMGNIDFQFSDAIPREIVKLREILR